MSSREILIQKVQISTFEYDEKRLFDTVKELQNGKI